jgi:hypothetical protein
MKIRAANILEYTYSPDEGDHWICPRCNNYVAIDDYEYLVCCLCFFIFEITHDNNSKDAIKHAYNNNTWCSFFFIYNFRIPTKYSIKGNTCETIEIEKKSESMVYIKSIGKVNINDVKIVSYKCSCVYGKNCTLE